jgi:hypothetical protein
MKSAAATIMLATALLAGRPVAAQARPLSESEALLAVARERAKSGWGTTVVTPSRTCWEVPSGDPLCIDGVRQPGADELARSRAEVFAAVLGSPVIEDSLYASRWQRQQAEPASDRRCGARGPWLNLVTPASVRTSPDSGDVVVRLNLASFPAGDQCEGSGMLVEYRVAPTAEGGAAVSSVRNILHFSGLRPWK